MTSSRAPPARDQYKSACDMHPLHPLLHYSRCFVFHRLLLCRVGSLALSFSPAAEVLFSDSVMFLDPRSRLSTSRPPSFRHTKGIQQHRCDPEKYETSVRNIIFYFLFFLRKFSIQFFFFYSFILQYSSVFKPFSATRKQTSG